MLLKPGMGNEWPGASGQRYLPFISVMAAVFCVFSQRNIEKSAKNPSKRLIIIIKMHGRDKTFICKYLFQYFHSFIPTVFFLDCYSVNTLCKILVY